MDIQPQEIDTFISEKVQVDVKEGDTVDTAKITNLVTKETPVFEGSIGQLKLDIQKLEEEKSKLTAQYAEQTAMYQEATKQVDDQIKKKVDEINKYTPEVEAKIASRKP